MVLQFEKMGLNHFKISHKQLVSNFRSSSILIIVVSPEYLFHSSFSLLFYFSEPPKFTRTPSRVSVVRPGQSKVFECQVTGTPEIDIYWFKEGSEISAGDRYKMVFVNSVATLEVCGAETKDGGLYYCEARNEAGSESCSMELKVKGLLG